MESVDHAVFEVWHVETSALLNCFYELDERHVDLISAPRNLNAGRLTDLIRS